MTDNDCALVIFTRAPVPGQVKTRLAACLGEVEAAELYQSLLRRTVQTGVEAGFKGVQLYCSGNLDHPFLLQCANDFKLPLYRQEGINLGARMYAALSGALESYTSAIIIGCDCPELTPGDLVRARTRLGDNYDCVLGPAEDGGYYLIGSNIAQQRLFEGITWGTASVFSETMQRLQDLELRCFELGVRWDLDRPEGLDRYNNLSPTHHLLNEHLP